MLRTLVAIGTSLLLFAAPAWAGDPVEDARIAEANTLLANLAAWTKAGDKPRLEKALPKAEKVHNELKTNSVRVKVQKAVGAIIGTEACGRVRMLAADSLGRFNDPKGAYKQLKPHLPPVKEAAAGLVPLRVVQATGALAPDTAIGTLTQLMEKAKDANVSRHAVQALGKYGWSRSRNRVLTSMAEYLRRLRPGGNNLKNGRVGGAATRERFRMLEQTMIVALQELTGQKTLDSTEKWLAAWKANKKQAAKLFTFER
ncbi:MAG: hypothetical protein P1V36_00565 [Planctomycetota bacterium]|nr:hypothetical protein [Planctomycetota bacterium]